MTTRVGATDIDRGTMTAHFRINKGLDLPITGEPKQVIEEAQPVTRVAVVGPDYVGMRPTMAVAEGDAVKLGQMLFEDKRRPGVRHVSPGTGRVVGVNRGARRVLQSVVVELSGEDPETGNAGGGPGAKELTREQVREKLVAAGLWVSLRTRPYGRTPPLGSVPRAVFVNAMDTNPLAVDPQVVLAGREEPFRTGLGVLGRLTDGPVYLCRAPGARVPGDDEDQVEVAEFSGPHPAGLSGTHVHFLQPVGPQRTVWTVNYQDVIAIGRYMTTGQLSVERVIALGGPGVERPRLLRTRLGACVSQLVAGQLEGGDVRVVSGSVLHGRTASGPFDFLGRHHLQITALQEGRERELLGWQMPGLNKFSAKNVFVSRLLPKRRFGMNTNLGGSARAMVPVGAYEDVMPLDILATPLLRALLVDDTEKAQLLGCLELDEEDLALCTFVSPGKFEFGPVLRRNLEMIERQG